MKIKITENEEHLDSFENRSDDWLAKQRDHEESVSAWDFDEGKKLKAEHEEKHRAYIQKQSEYDKHTWSPAEKIAVIVATMFFITVAYLVICIMCDVHIHVY